MLRYRIFILLNILLTSMVNGQQFKKPADYVDPFIGSINSGSCMPGTCMPHASVYPSPNTIKCSPGGYAVNEKISGFAQLHTQGTGGVKSYGNFLISPQIGLQINEIDHQSGKEEEFASVNHYKVYLKKYGIKCEFTPSENAVLYKFTYPVSDRAFILLDVARKTGAEIGLENGSVQISPDHKSIYGGGSYGKNWPDEKHKWNMFFYAEFSEPALKSGTFKDGNKLEEQYASTQNSTLGAYLGFKTKLNQAIYVKIAVSFISTEHAKQLLHKEIPGWDIELQKANVKKAWNRYLFKIKIEANDEDKIIFYTHLFHAFVQPRNRTGNNLWQTQEVFWDDHYTLWDSWKTLFPLMSLIDSEMVSSNIQSFINRFKHNGYVAEAFINGKESAVGQGGNIVDNIIGDAFVKKVPSINWEDAYKVLKYNADSMRTSSYLNQGFVNHKEPNNYSRRFFAGSGTLQFSYNDYCVANLAKGLGHMSDYNLYSKRSENWKNIWNSKASSDGYQGFIMARKQDGIFDSINPKKGVANHFYEGSCWEYSYEIPHDVKEMVNRMGGKELFVERLKYAMNNNLIDFGNEPSFMTPWLFSNENVNRPDLTSYYIRNKLLPLFTRFDLPGDDDQGAMASLFIFAKLGLFPFAGTNKYYLHGGSYKSVTLQLADNKKFEIKSKNASPENIYIKSVKLNGEKLNRSWLNHEEIIRGGILEFDMTNIVVNYIKEVK